nr:transmembrane repetitive protein [Stenotrophomonas sp. MMGLT7]
MQALLARRPAPLLERRTGLPHGWAIWLDSLRPVQVPFDGNEVAREMASHAPAGRERGSGAVLGFWQAFRRLWWQGWEPAPADQRGLRRLAALASFLLHVLLALALLWIAHVHWAVPPDDADDSGQSGRMQLRFVGRGTQQEQGGGQGEAPPAAATGAAARRQAVPRSAAPAQAQPGPAAPSPEPPADTPAPESPVAEQPPTAAAAPQPLQVTEAPVPTSDFVLPPPPAMRAAPAVVPAPATTQLQVIEREVRPVEDAPPAPPRIQPREVVVPAPSVATEVREREVTTVPRADVQVPQVRQREPETALRMPELEVRQAELPAPEIASTSTSTSASAAADSAEAAASPASAQAAPAAPGSTPAASAGSGSGQAPAPPSVAPGAPGTASAPGQAGPRAVDRSGGWDSAARADDWGAAARSQRGDAGASARQGEGLFDADGRARVPGAGQAGSGSQGRGAPGGGADTWTRDRIAESGTWLKRPPYDYTPTSLDRYWVPNESLLEEWVRKGIKKIEIPIPGTSARISCVVSLLQFGGGCGLTNPNMNEQPATARPPPDVPFKKELQEDNGSER